MLSFWGCRPLRNSWYVLDIEVKHSVSVSFTKGHYSLGIDITVDLGDRDFEYLWGSITVGTISYRNIELRR